MCYSKTERTENYFQTVPVFTRGYHPIVGLGFSSQQFQALHEIQLPLAITPARNSRRGNLSDYRQEITILDKADVK